MIHRIIKFLKFYLWQWWRIPSGSYCYKITSWKRDPEGKKPPVIKTKICPYYDIKDEWPEQANGYCHFLGWGDMDKNNDETVILTDMKTGEEIAAPDFPFGVGLLWDQVKECGVKPYDKQDKEYIKEMDAKEIAEAEGIDTDKGWAKLAKKAIRNWAKDNPY